MMRQDNPLLGNPRRLKVILWHKIGAVEIVGNIRATAIIRNRMWGKGWGCFGRRSLNNSWISPNLSSSKLFNVNATSS
jgi:hypothetical protein